MFGNISLANVANTLKDTQRNLVNALEATTGEHAQTEDSNEQKVVETSGPEEVEPEATEHESEHGEMDDSQAQQEVWQWGEMSPEDFDEDHDTNNHDQDIAHEVPKDGGVDDVADTNRRKASTPEPATDQAMRPEVAHGISASDPTDDAWPQEREELLKKLAAMETELANAKGDNQQDTIDHLQSTIKTQQKDHAKATKILEAKVAASTKKQSDLAMETQTAKEALESLKGEFCKTQQKDQKRLQMVKKERDDLKAKLNEKKGFAIPPAGDHQEPADSEALEALKTEGEKLAKDLGIRNERIKELARQKKDLEAEVEDLSQQLGEKKEAERQWNITKVQYDEEVASLRNKVKESEGLIAKQKADVGSQDKHIKALQKQIAELQSSLTSSGKARSQEASSMQRSMEAKEQALAVELASTRQAIDLLDAEKDAKISSLLAELDASQKQLHIAEQKAMDAASLMPETVQPLMEQIETLEARFRPMEVKLAEKDAALNAMKQEKTALETSTATLDRRLQAALKSHTERQSAAQKVEKDLTSQLETSKTKLAEAQKSIRDVQKEKLKFQRDFDALSEKCKEMDQALSLCREELKVAQFNAKRNEKTPPRPESTRLNPPSLRPTLGPKKEVESIPKPVATAAEIHGTHGSEADVTISDNHLHASLSLVSGAKDILQKELQKCMKENAELKASISQYLPIKKKYGELFHRYNVLLELLGEREEETQKLQAQLDSLRDE